MRALSYKAHPSQIEICVNLLNEMEISVGHAQWHDILHVINQVRTRSRSFGFTLRKHLTGHASVIGSHQDISSSLHDSITNIQICESCKSQSMQSLSGHRLDCKSSASLSCPVHSILDFRDTIDDHANAYSTIKNEILKDETRLEMGSIEIMDNSLGFSISESMSPVFSYETDSSRTHSRSREWIVTHWMKAIQFWQYHTLYQSLKIWTCRLEASSVYNQSLKQRMIAQWKQSFELSQKASRFQTRLIIKGFRKWKASAASLWVSLDVYLWTSQELKKRTITQRVIKMLLQNKNDILKSIADFKFQRLERKCLSVWKRRLQERVDLKTKKAILQKLSHDNFRFRNKYRTFKVALIR